MYFYPRPPRGGRPSTLWSSSCSRYFYPRPPRGGRRSAHAKPSPSSLFLSTPSARRATGHHPRLRSGGQISIHALREEGDKADLQTDKAGGHFYPRPPRGGRPPPIKKCDVGIRISIHALREEGDAFPAGGRPLENDFYPRPPRGGRRSSYRSYGTAWQFLSTPSARRATLLLARARWNVPISIHALREEGDTRLP